MIKKYNTFNNFTENIQENNMDNSNPRKLTDNELNQFLIKDIKKLKVQIGQLNSYIEELGEPVNVGNLTIDERTEIKKETFYKEQLEHIQKLESIIKKLRKDNDDLMVNLIKYKNQ